MSLGTGELLVLLVILIVGGIPLFSAVDVALKPASAFRAAGHSKTLWVALHVVGILVGLGLIAAAIYAFAIRPKVVATET